MLVLSKQTTTPMADDGLTNLNWLVQKNPIARLSPSTPPASPNSLPYSSNASSSSGSDHGHPNVDYTRERIKPPYSYAQMITMAMESHGGRKVLLTDIYSWIRDNFAYFRGNDTSWQNSVRHNLSLNKQFVKVPRDPKDKGKGSYWKLDASSCNLTKDPYCLRRRNFADTGSSSKRVHRPEVSHPQVNPAIKTFLERVRRLQEARRHPFAGTGEIVEDIGAQECVYSDTEPLFDDFNRKLFKKDVELYDPSGYCPLISTCPQIGSKKRDGKDLNLSNLTPLTSPECEFQDAQSQSKVRVEYNWEAYEYHPSAVGGAQLPLEPEPNRLDLRIPTPEWWTTNSNSNTHNLLLSPSNANPMVKVFENLNNSGCSSILNHDSSACVAIIMSPDQCQEVIALSDHIDPNQCQPDQCTEEMPEVIDQNIHRIQNGHDEIPNDWNENEETVQDSDETLLLDLDYSNPSRLESR